MRFGEFGCAVVACGMLAASLVPVGAEESPLLALKQVTGKCANTLHAGQIPGEQACSGIVYYWEFRDGFRGISFSNGPTLFTFVGKGTGWNQKSGGRINVTLLWTATGKNAAEFPAKGYCRFDNLHAGKEVAIACAATMKAGHWSAAFRTDGKPLVDVKLKH